MQSFGRKHLYSINACKFGLFYMYLISGKNSKSSQIQRVVHYYSWNHHEQFRVTLFVSSKTWQYKMLNLSWLLAMTETIFKTIFFTNLNNIWFQWVPHIHPPLGTNLSHRSIGGHPAPALMRLGVQGSAGLLQTHISSSRIQSR